MVDNFTFYVSDLSIILLHYWNHERPLLCFTTITSNLFQVMEHPASTQTV